MRSFFREAFFIVAIIAIGLLPVNLAGDRLSSPLPARADEIEDLEKEKQAKEAEKKAKEEQAQQVKAEKQEVSSQKQKTEGKISQAEQTVTEKKRLIETLKEQKKRQEIALQEKVTAQEIALRAFYKLGKVPPAEAFFAFPNLGKFSLFWEQYQISVGNLLARINNLKGQIASLKADLGITINQKKELENKVAVLGEQKEFLQTKEQELAKLHQGLQEEILGLENEIAQLTARQQEILSARSGSFTTSVGDVPLADDFNASPAFRPEFSPAFAVFSFGAYTHRKGMSQYGAKGRAEQGQDYKQILQAYYGKGITKIDTDRQINVNGVEAMDFENRYLLGIAEMPASFPKEALKAQAVAARSYAWRFVAQGQSICATQACQVFLPSKADNPPNEWRQAVEETRGEIIPDVVTYYSSTAGGYLTTMGWDTTDGSGGSDWTNKAYEALAKSPWFYKAWYTKDYYQQSAKCGRSHPWLTEAEMADILNGLVVLQKGNQEDVDRVLPVTNNECPISGTGGNPFSLEELRQKAEQLGGAYTSIGAITVSHTNGGETGEVRIQTNRGQVTISGADFKKAFNLRAPGYISVRSPLYNIERK